MSNVPRILIAAPKSGTGKTLFTCGFLNLLKKNNDVCSFKCGPDYIDPMFHREVIGIEARNLDSFFQDKDMIVSKLSACQLKRVVIEGVMGLYDGINLNSLSASSYEIAQYARTPVLLLIDGKGAGRTLISVIKGMLIDDTDKLIKGIVINNISKAYYDRLYPVVNDELKKINSDAELLGCLPKLKDVNLESRHLGLVMPDEIAGINEMLDIVSDAIQSNCNVSRILEIMNEADDLQESDENAVNPIEKVRLAVARDEAFCFYYKDNFDLLESYGVELVPFSPVHDKRLPDNIAGLLLGGGYPENYLGELSANSSMLESIKKSLDDGMPCLAECGGYMYLHSFVEDVNGKEYPLVNFVKGKCYYTGKLVRFGYVEINSENKEGLSAAISSMRGHEFHYYDSDADSSSLVIRKASTGVTYNAMVCGDNYVAGFPHMYYPSNRGFIESFVKCMLGYRG